MSNANRQLAAVQRFNLRFFLISSGIAVVAIVVAVFVHSLQRNRISRAMLEQAEKSAEDEDWRRASTYLFQYLRLQPNDDETRVRLARYFDKSTDRPGRVPRAINLYYQALAVAGDDEVDELRARVAELLLSRQRYLEVISEVDALRDSAEYRKEALRLNALAWLRRTQQATEDALGDPKWANEVGPEVAIGFVANQSPELALAFATILRQHTGWLSDRQKLNDGIYTHDDPKHVQPSVHESDDPDNWAADSLRSADLSTQAGRDNLADKIMLTLIEHDKSPEAYLAQILYCLAYDKPEVEQFVEEAIRLAQSITNERESRNQKIVEDPGLSDEEKELALEVASLRNELDVYQFAGVYFLSQASGLDEDQSAPFIDRAEEQYDLYVRCAPESPNGYYGLGNIYAARSDYEKAVEFYKKGTNLAPEPDVLVVLRMADALVLLGDVDAAKTLLDELTTTLDRFATTQEVRSEALRELMDATEFLTCRVLLMEGSYEQAISRLGELSGQFSSQNEVMAYKISFALGQASGAQRAWDRAAMFYDEASSLRPDDEICRVLAADAAVRANLKDLAVEQLESLATQRQTAEDWFNLAVVRFEQQLARPIRDRQFESLSRALSEAKKNINDESMEKVWRIDLLELDYLRVDNQSGTAVDGAPELVNRIRKALDEYGNDAELAARLVQISEQIKQTELADEILALMSQSATPSQYGISRAVLMSSRKQFDEARQAIAEARLVLETEEEKREMDLVEVQVLVSEGKIEEAILELANITNRYREPSTAIGTTLDRDLASRIFELAYVADLSWQDLPQLPAASNQPADANVATWLDLLEVLEGENGPMAMYLQARDKLIELSESNVVRRKEQLIADIENLYGKVRGTRPRWQVNLYLEGLLAESVGDWPSARRAFQKGIERGDSRPVVFQRLIRSLYMDDENTLAEQYLAMLAEGVPRSASLSAFSINLAARQQQMEVAEQRAREGTVARGRDPLAWIWYAQMLYVNDKHGESEQAFLEATRVAPDSVDAWSGIFSFYIFTDRKEDAEQKLHEMVEAVNATPFQRQFLYAQGFEYLRDRVQAAKHYDEALQFEPDRVDVLVRMAQFYIVEDPSLSASLLEHALEVHPQLHDIRRLLAGVLARLGDDDSWARSVALLEQQDNESDNAGLDERLRAVLLVDRGKKSLDRREEYFDEALSIADQLVRMTTAPLDGDRILRASILLQKSLCTADEQKYRDLVSNALQEYELVCVKADANPRFFVSLIELLLQQERLTDARHWIGQLEEKVGISPKTAQLGVRLRVLEGNTEEAVQYAQEAIEGRLSSATSDDARAETYVFGAGLYAAADRHDLALVAAQEAVKLNEAEFANLAIAYVDVEQNDAAIDLCLERFKNLDERRDATLVLATVLVRGQSTPEQFERTADTLATALDEFPEDADILSSIGGVNVVRGDIETAISLYERARLADPENAIVLNNLATLLLEDSVRRHEAFDAIDAAIGLYGHQAALLDTKGMALFYDELWGQAVDVLTLASRHEFADARVHFHRALALSRIEGSDGKPLTRAAFQKALDLNLKDLVLTEKDQEHLRALEQSLGLAP